MPLLLGPIGVPELIIILVVVLVLFGGSRLAGLGKGVGRSIREFKEEVTQDQKSVESGEHHADDGGHHVDDTAVVDNNIDADKPSER
ncbi:MAG: twin-arginine translocase TatA/TatE family subunit [Propionibacteriaceae bacterium]|nr:twin-arginine translocase TatA/TatE family subunit [Propionibacteriaceae bacterium]